MPKMDKVLIVRLGSLGDILHALPAQQLLHSRLPGAGIDWLTAPQYVPLLRCVPGIRNAWPVDPRRWQPDFAGAPSTIRLLRSLRRERFDLVVDFQGLLKSAVLARIAGRGQVVGFKAERFKEKGTGWLYTHREEGESDLGQHVIDANLKLVKRFVGGEHDSAVVPFQIPHQDQEYVRRRLSDLEMRRPVLLNPGAGWVTKRWPARDYGRLARMIVQDLGFPVAVTYGPGEEEVAEEVKREAGTQNLAAFPTTITQLAALCRVSRLMVAGDTGPLHLAVSTGTPVVAILGPTAAGRNGPYSEEDVVVKRDLPCSNSYKRVCDEFICMDIPVETVLGAVQRRLEVADSG